MKYLLFTILGISALLFSQCRENKENMHSNDIPRDSIYKYINEQFSKYIFEYRMGQIGEVDSVQEKRLKIVYDSAVYFANRGYDEFPNDIFFIYRKVSMLLDLKHFDEAIELSQKHPIPIVELPDYPYMKIIINRFNAMKCMSSNSMEERDKYLKNAIEEIEQYVLNHRETIEGSLINKDGSFNSNSPYYFPLEQYYVYSLVMYDKVQVLKKIQSLFQLSPTMSYHFADNYTHEDFEVFNGI